MPSHPIMCHKGWVVSECEANQQVVDE